MAERNIPVGELQGNQIMLNPQMAQMMGGGGVQYAPYPMPQSSGINLRALKGGLQAIAGIFQYSTLKTLEKRAQDANDAVKAANLVYATKIDILRGDPSNGLKQLDCQVAALDVDQKTQVANQANIELGKEQSRSVMYSAAGGALDVASEYMRPEFSAAASLMGGGGGYAPQYAQPQYMPQPVQYIPMAQPNGGSILVPVLAGMAGGVLANNLLPAASK